MWLWRVHGPGGSWVVLVDGNRLGLTRVRGRLDGLGLLGIDQGRLGGILPIYRCGVEKKKGKENGTSESLQNLEIKT